MSITVAKKSDEPTLVKGTCVNSKIVITATPENGGQIDWFNEEKGTTIIDQGNEYTAQGSGVYTYYAEEGEYGNIKTVGMDMSDSKIKDNDKYFLQFDVFKHSLLKSVEIFADVSGLRTIQLLDKNDQVLSERKLQLFAGNNTATLNFILVPETGYKLKYDDLVESSWSGSTNFPYKLGEILTITNTGGGSSAYHYFFNWKVQTRCSSERAKIDIDIDCVNSIEDNNQIDFDIYPNPGQGVYHLNIDLMVASKIDIVVYDILGNIVYHQEIEKQAISFNEIINLSSLAKGAYFLKISSDKKLSVKKLIQN
jgi:hypothetical protein